MNREVVDFGETEGVIFVVREFFFFFGGRRRGADRGREEWFRNEAWRVVHGEVEVGRE